MRDCIDHHDVANAVMMLRSGFKGTFVIVEGNTDDRLYGKFMDPEDTDIVVAQSKSNVDATLKELSRRGEDRCLGIVDSDLDIVKGIRRKAPLFETDTRDAESLMFFSNALDSLLSEYGDRESVSRFVERHGDLRKVVCDACMYIGMLMLISQREGLNLSFKNLDFGYFIDRRTLRCDVRRLVTELLGGRLGENISPERILRLLTDEKEYDHRAICRGHDITEVLAIGLREIFGSYNAKSISSAQVAGGLRLAFGPDDLKATGLYTMTTEWASSRGIPLWKV